MVALVDVGLGPLMTLILYRKNKPGLKFDLAVIASVQMVALCYGVWVLHSQKPTLTVFSDGMFVCLNSSQVSFAGADVSRFDDDRFTVPVAVLPELTQTQLMEWQERQKTLPENYPKHPAYVYGKQLTEYGPKSYPSIVEQEWDLTHQLELSADARAEWAAYQGKYGTDAGHAFFVLTCGRHQYMVAMNPLTGELVDALDIPFINARQKKNVKPSK